MHAGALGGAAAVQALLAAANERAAAGAATKAAPSLLGPACSRLGGAASRDALRLVHGCAGSARAPGRHPAKQGRPRLRWRPRQASDLRQGCRV